MAQERKPLGKILAEMKAASDKQIKEALKFQHDNPGKKLGEILVEQGVVKPIQLAQALAKQFEMPFVNLGALEIAGEVVQSVPKQVAEEYKIIPIKKNGRLITVAMSDPLDFFTLDNLRFILNTEIECALATKEDVVEALAKYYGGGMKSEIGNVLEELTQSDLQVRTSGDTAPAGEEEEGDDAPVIRLVTLIITEAIKARVSDIHVEPMDKKLRIRYRVDGICKEVDSPPKRLQAAIISRLKIMAQMDIAEKRKPQDGRIQISTGGKDLDLRVNALPASHGESVVMRILDKQKGLVPLEDLGLHPDDYKRFKAIIKRPNGVFLVTGPTGSGKTTTLYAALKELNRPDVKIITAENPVEYTIPGINQSQVKAQIGMTFARILRAMLRQAPNIILVGEIRDEETAKTAVEAALTGHLVFSTLHTNDAPASLTRLIDMGVKPFLVASSVQAILAQRLVRILCPHCREPYQPDEAELKSVNLTQEDIEGKNVSRPVGCDDCKGQGYRGRKGVYELLEMNGVLREMTFKKEPTMRLMEQARVSGMVTLLEDGVRKILEGTTTFKEVLNIAKREDIAY